MNGCQSVYMARHKMSLNTIIWKRCSKEVYVGRTALSLGISSAVINFNNGAHGLLEVKQEYELKDGEFCSNFSTFDSNQIM